MIRVLFTIFKCIILHVNNTMTQLFSCIHPQNISFPNGITLSISKPSFSGSYSYIYACKPYAAKQIYCHDEESYQSCQREINIHDKIRNDNILPLMSVKYKNEGERKVCYLLFPLIQGSLRDDISKRLVHKKLTPLKEHELLFLLRGILNGVQALHEVNVVHGDIKPENILLDKNHHDIETGYYNIGTPLLIDFGSIRPLTIYPTSRLIVNTIIEEASHNCTLPYRAPELFDCHYGPVEAPIDGKSDVWSCGCVLYAMLYGYSPFEMDFRKDGSVRVVKCSYLRVLSGVKFLDEKDKYSATIKELIMWMLIHDRVKRPGLEEVIRRVEEIMKGSTILRV